MRYVWKSVLTVAVLTVAGISPAAAAPGEDGPRTWRVGPDRSLTVPSAAAALARDRDTVLIDAGTYSGDVATWTQDDLTLYAARSSAASTWVPTNGEG